MSLIQKNLYYSPSHEWVRQEEDGTVTIGVSDHAQCLLGEVVFVELPELNEQLALGEEAAVLESVKAAADVYAPVAGEIVAVNPLLTEQPDLINQSPYENGWILRIKPNAPGAFPTLMDATQYETHIANEK